MAKIYTIPLKSVGTHETIVLVIDGEPKSVDTWNFSEDEQGNRTFYIEGVTTWQLTIRAGTMVQVVR